MNGPNGPSLGRDPHGAMSGTPSSRRLGSYSRMKDSGVAWLGQVPEHWQLRKLRQCGTIIGGMTPSMDVRPFWDGFVPWITPKDMKAPVLSDSGTRVTPAALKETGLRLVDPPAVLLVVRGMILARKVPIARTTAAVTVNQDMKALRPHDAIDARYLAAAMDSAQSAFIPLIDEAGHGTRRLPTERWREILVPLPPASEQETIVRFLDDADRRIRRYIRAKQKLIGLLEEQKQAIVHRAVTRGLDPDVRLKPSGVEWLGDVPEHWQVRRIATLAHRLTNGWVGPTRSILVSEGIRYVQSLHIKNGRIRFNKPYFVSREWLQLNERIRLRQGDVLVVQTGDIGQVAQVPAEFEGSGCHALIIVRAKKRVIDATFLTLVLQSRYGQWWLRFLQTGALHPHLNCTWVREIPVPLPSRREQGEIANRLHSSMSVLDEAIRSGETQISLVHEYRTRLLADVVTGKLDVREAAASLPDESDAALADVVTGEPIDDLPETDAGETDGSELDTNA